MGRVPITVMGYKCERCEHEWVPREANDDPRVCPKCKSPYWNRPRKVQQMTYDEFKDKVADVLRRAGKELTWTEIRTEAKLAQALPNNQWVRRMESDIGLLRRKDTHGIMHWTFKRE